MLIVGVVPSDSERESVEPQTLSLSGKREAFFVQSREDINFDGALVKTPPVSRKKIHGIEYGGEHWWTARRQSGYGKNGAERKPGSGH